MSKVARFDFLEMILQAFTIDGEGQRVALSSAEISCGTLRMTTEKVGFLGADAGAGFFRLVGVEVIEGLFAVTLRVTDFRSRLVTRSL
jgi:hypothetical protein